MLVALIVGALAMGMLPLSGESTGGPTVGRGGIAFYSDRDGDVRLRFALGDGAACVGFDLVAAV